VFWVAVGIVVVASLALMGAGWVFRWDVMSAGYNLSARVIGAVALLALVLVAAYAKRDAPLMAGSILVGGVGLAIGFIVLHARLTRRLRATLAQRGDGRIES